MKQILGALVLLALTSGTAAKAQSKPAASPPPSTATGVTEVVVTVDRPQAETLIDRKVFNIANDIQATTGTAADILNNVPSVTVDADGNVSLRGDGSVTILVDGKPSAQFSGPTRSLSLQQFPASEIARVEVIANPPAQYKAEGSGGVINIITKKSHRDGFSGSGQLSLGEKGRYIASLNGSYSTGRLKLFGGLGLRRDIRERISTSDRTATDLATNVSATSTQSIDEHFRRLLPSVKAGADYELNDRQAIGVSFDRHLLSGPRYFDQHDVSGPPGGAPDNISDRHSDGHEWSLDGSQEAHFEQKLWRPGETLNLALQRSLTQEREHYAYRNTFTLPAAGPAFDDLRLNLDLVKTEASADYELPLAGDRDLKFGYDFEGDANDFNNSGDNRDPITGVLTSNPNVTDHFRYHQQINAAYGQYQQPLGPWTLQGGLRLEATHVATLLVTGDIAGGRNDFAAYPSLHLDRGLGGEAKLSASIGRRVTQPDPEDLNPFTDHQDTHNLRAGNADLKPKDTWSYELGYSNAKGSLSYGATAYYRANRNSVTDVLRPVSDEVVLATKANLPKDQSAGIEFNANGKLGSKLSYGFSGDVFLSQIDATALGAPGLKSTTGVNLKASLNYQPITNGTAQISFSRSDKRLTPQGSVSAVNLVNLGYRQQLRPNLSLVFTMADVLNGQRNRRIVTTSGLTGFSERHQLGRIAMIGMVRTFGGQKPPQPSAFQYDP